MICYDFLILTLVLGALLTRSAADYEPSWYSLDSRPIPQWYEDAKFGVMMHWGLYSVPSVGPYPALMWDRWRVNKHYDFVDYMKKNYKPGFQYADFAPLFTADLFNATKFAEIVRNSGARYYIFSAKHHDGYTMWKSDRAWNWNAVETGPHRDLLGELKEAFRTTAPDVKFGVYFSMFDWFHPLFLVDSEKDFSSRQFPEAVSTPQLYDLVRSYKPDILWTDGDDMAPESYWRSKEFLAWLFNESPVMDSVVVNDRWGKGDRCSHGGFHTCTDRFAPGTLRKHKWENHVSISQDSWGFRRDSGFGTIMTLNDIIRQLIRTVSCGGNLLLNVGPTHDGRIIPIYEERLAGIGKWLENNGEAIYGTRPWVYQNDTINPDVWYTSRMTDDTNLDPNRVFNPQIEDRTILYVILLKWPQDGIMRLGSPRITAKTVTDMLGYPEQHVMTNVEIQPPNTVEVDLRPLSWWKLPSTTAWAFRMTNLAADGRVPVSF